MFRRKPKDVEPSQWLIVGLGNPGPEYRGTRHNVGFAVIDELSERHRIKIDRSRLKARVGSGKVGGIMVTLAKPMTYMNLSGQAIAPLLRDLNLKPDRLIVVADETDLPLGRIRLRARGGPGGHNGHKSIIGSLGTQDYARLRLGIGRVDKSETVDHVLGQFEFDERAIAEEMVRRAAEAVAVVVLEGLEAAMNSINPTKDD